MRATEDFEALLARALPDLRQHAARLTGNVPDTDDVVQESVHRALRGFEGFRRGTNFRGWMLRIVTNTFLQRVGREARQVDWSPEADLAAPGSSEPGHPLQERRLTEIVDAARLGQEPPRSSWEAFADGLDGELKRALGALPADFRRPLLLSALGGLGTQEMADILQVPVGTVMSRLFRARTRLRTALESAPDPGGRRWGRG